MRRRKRIVTRTLAFAKKEFKLVARYKWHFISITIVLPILTAIPLIVLYWGIVSTVPEGWTLNPDNYLPWVLLGSLIYSTFIMGYTEIRAKFSKEKYWMTIHGTLIAPVSKYYLLFGMTIELWIRSTVTSFIFIGISFLVSPTGMINVVCVYGLLLITLIGAAGIGILNGAVYLINENFAPIFSYVLYFLVFLSTYSIPLEIYPDFLKFLILANPLFHYINLSRDLWINEQNLNSLWSFLYLLIFTVICVIVGVYFFSKLTRRFGVRGY